MHPFSQISPSSTITARPRECSSTVHLAVGSASFALEIISPCSDCTVLANRSKLDARGARRLGAIDRTSETEKLQLESSLQVLQEEMQSKKLEAEKEQRTQKSGC